MDPSSTGETQDLRYIDSGAQNGPRMAGPVNHGDNYRGPISGGIVGGEGNLNFVQYNISHFYVIMSRTLEPTMRGEDGSRTDSDQSDRHSQLRIIAEETLNTLQHGSYTFHNVLYDLESRIRSSNRGTSYYGPDSRLSTWASNAPVQPSGSTPPSEISILEISTIDGARLLSNTDPAVKLGILNFASAKKPGGEFMNGTQGQEESIARASTLYPTLITTTGQQFYTLHRRDPEGGYYSHAMIYSPGVVFFRDDNGGWMAPVKADVLTSPAVNASVARTTLHGHVAGRAVEYRIEAFMRERMARILFLFEKKGVQNVVLGSFGTGASRNDVGLVARIWADLLVGGEARFRHAFKRVVFGILDKGTYETFKDAFCQRVKERSNPSVDH